MIVLMACAPKSSAATPAEVGRLHRDFFHAWRATGIELDRLAARAATEDFALAAESARALAQTINQLPRFSADLAADRRPAYLLEAEELHVLVDQVGALARCRDAPGLMSAVARLRTGRQEIGRIVPRLWLSVASTLKGRTQPGSRLMLE